MRQYQSPMKSSKTNLFSTQQSNTREKRSKRYRRVNLEENPITSTWEEVIEIARLIRAYMKWQDMRLKTPVWPIHVRLARTLLGLGTRIDAKTRRPKWRLMAKDWERHCKRLRSAGIDPETWEIVDEERAKWCWWQLRHQKYYSERTQARLIGSGEKAPSLDIPYKFDREKIREIMERKEYVQKQKQGTIKEYDSEIIDRLFSGQ